MLYVDKIFLTIAALCVLGWISILPMIQLGMGAGKLHHQYWKDVTEKAMAVVAAIFSANAFCFIIYHLWLL